MQARYYDPVIGRFYSNDPVDTLGHFKNGDQTSGFNRYRYAKNNPYKYVDPDGKIDIFANFANLSKNNEASNRVSSIQKTMSKKGVETTDKVIKTSMDVMQTAAELSPQGKASKAIMAVTTVAVSALKAQGTDDPSKSFGIDMAVEAISLGVSKKVDSLLELTGLDDATKKVVSSTIKDSATNTFRDAIDDK
jgi:uncharacterized protein RhaS with RHS repeats